MPDDPVGQALLRDLCRETLAFENHYLALYRVHLLQQLRKADETCVRFAVERLDTVRYLDAEVTDALHEIVASDPADLRNATYQYVGSFSDYTHRTDLPIKSDER
ncbi:MAG: hypothetical protein ACR2M3_17770 [Thermomicrobiales bacterium]